ncbi:MAG: LacI family transcriptional regulator [Treponema sp.]|nr:LacI family transcriptional regulator [Treponema sp.]
MKDAKQVTIYDVAKKAGVSPATVSRVLNEPEKVAIEKKDAVLKAIDELKFTPKADAVANARKAYKKIGVVAPFFTQPSFMERLRGICSVLAAEHYEVVIYTINTVEDLNNYVTSLVTANRVDGLIFLCVQLEKKMLKLLHNAEFPVCFVENQVDEFDCVTIDNYYGGKKAAEYFYDLGCKNPAFLGEGSFYEYAVHATEDRINGYKNFFESEGIKISEDNIWISEFTEQKLDEGIESFLKKSNKPDCVFCSSDLIASKFVHMARTEGINIPEDIKVLGFDDIDISEHIGLSSISQHLEESGMQAGSLVIDRIKNPKKSPVTVTLQLKIMERMTSKQ